MILSDLQHTERIEQLHPLFKEVFDYVKSHDLLHAECGKIELRGKDLFLNIANPTLIPQEEQVLELHRKYIDIQIVLEGKERMGWRAIDEVKEVIQEYNPEKDCAMYSDRPTTYVDVEPGQFTIFFPEDPHAPIIGNGKVKKVIAKVKI